MMNNGNAIRNAKGICVYGIRCKETGRIYIGSTCELENRLKSHFRILKNNHKYITSKRKGKQEHPFQTDFNKYGIESFEAFVLEENIPERLRDEREELWIDLYCVDNPKYGYNILNKCNRKNAVHKTNYPVPVYFERPPIPEVRNDI